MSSNINYIYIIIQICEFFGVSLEYLLIDEKDKTKKEKYNIHMGSDNTYNGNVTNITGKTVTVNNVISSKPETTQKNQEYNSKYPTVIMYLDSLDEKNKRHAIVDVEYMLENEYCVSEKTNKQSRNADYQRIIAYLDSLDEKNCRHAVVDVEYLLEVEYGVKKNNRNCYLSVYKCNGRVHKHKQHQTICSW